MAAAAYHNAPQQMNRVVTQPLAMYSEPVRGDRCGLTLTFAHTHAHMSIHTPHIDRQ